MHALRTIVAVLSLGIDAIISFTEEVKALATEPPDEKNKTALLDRAIIINWYDVEENKNKIDGSITLSASIAYNLVP